VEFRDGGGERRIQGNLEEIAEWRAVVLTESEIPQETEVKIVADRYTLSGAVQGNSYDPALGYFHEIRLAADSRWDVSEFQPMHLLKIPLATPE
jgi:hypothetical protein